MTTRTKIKPTAASLESLLQCDRDSFKALLRESLQEVLEAEMTEAVGAAPGERTEQRVGYRAGYYGRSLVTLTPPRFHVHQIVVNFLVNGERNGEE